ncbi:MAG: serine/threonine-protein kinase [Myxococcota bacterium]
MRVGPYELLERIGVGGMAEVFRARQSGADGFERFVAVKRILPGISEDEDFVKMFIDEAKIAVQLAHPNIAQIYDLGMDGDVYFIAQEYIHGRDMGAIAERYEASGQRLPIDLVVYVGMKICEALQHAHTARGVGGQPLQVIHRDVSPSNVLVSYEGAVKVIDFGLAKAAGRLSTTQVGVVKGKLAYLSAEQALGQDIDSRSDLFSLGTCLFEWLTGQRLFLRRTDPETVVAIQRAEVPPPRALRPDIPPPLQAIVLNALQPDPNQRFQSASEMGDALINFAYDARMVARGSGLGVFVRGLFPEDFPDQPVELLDDSDLIEEPPKERPKRDTEPVPSAPERPKRTTRPMLLDEFAESSDEAFLDVTDEELSDAEEFELVTTSTGERARKALTVETPRDPASDMAGFDDPTADFRKEAVRMALEMRFEDTTAAIGRRPVDLTGGPEEDSTTTMSEDVLQKALAYAKPPAKPPAKPETILPPPGPDGDFTDQTTIDTVFEEDTNPEIQFEPE